MDDDLDDELFGDLDDDDDLDDDLDDEEAAVEERFWPALDAGPVVVTDFAASLAADEELYADGEPLDQKYLEALLLELPLYEPDLWEHEGRIDRIDRILSGRIFTHRLTAADLASGTLSLEGDVDIAGIDLERADDLNHLPLPPDQLAGLAEKSLIGVRRQGETLELEVVHETADGQAELAALLEGLQPILDKGHGDELTLYLLNAMLIDPSLFTTAVAPLSELLTGAGISRYGAFFGPSDRIWFPHAYNRSLLARAGATHQLNRCCLDALELVLNRWRAMELDLGPDSGIDVPTDAATLHALGHTDTASIFVEEISASGQVPSSLARFTALMAERASGDTVGLDLLAGCAADASGQPERAEHHYRRALAADPEAKSALEGLAMIEYERSNFAAANRLFRQVYEPDHMYVTATAQLAGRLLTAGRNDPCPCGSGRKYKKCHAGATLTDPDQRIGIVMHKLANFATSPRRRPAASTASWAARLNPETLFTTAFPFECYVMDELNVGAYRTQRGSLLPPDEADLLDRLLAEPLRLVEIELAAAPERAGVKRTVTLHDLVTDERLPCGLDDTGEDLPGGQLALVRLVDGRVAGHVVRIRPDHRGSLHELLSSGRPSLVQLLAWYGQLVDHEAEAALD